MHLLLELCGLSLLGVVAAERAIVFVKQRNVDLIFAELSTRADPRSGAYLRWLSHGDVSSLLQPHEDHMRAVETLAREHGARAVSRINNGDKIDVTFDAVPADFLAEARAMEEVDLVTCFATTSPTSPPPFSIGLTRRQRPRHGHNASTNSGGGGGVGGAQSCLASLDGVSPTCLRKAYGLDANTTAASTDVGSMSMGGQAFAVNQAFAPSDLSAFQSQFSLTSNPVKHIVGTNLGKAGDEATLDAEMITTTGQGIDTTFVYLDGAADNPFTNWLVWAGNTSDDQLPKVHSLSVGAGENEVGDDIIGRMNTEMAALGLRGVTIVFASGDSGYQQHQKYGAASPYVTSVGGIFNGELRDGLLQADSLTTGGFASSELNKVQPWQQAAIESYKKNKRAASLPVVIPTTQRAVPDVSAYDDDITIVFNGAETSLSGTSAACPIVAGMLAKINQALADAGHKTTIGFANPLLYANEPAFLDIEIGNNRGVRACKGYDPLTGLGTFSTTTFTSLKAAALKAAARTQHARTNSRNMEEYGKD